MGSHKNKKSKKIGDVVKHIIAKEQIKTSHLKQTKKFCNKKLLELTTFIYKMHSLNNKITCFGTKGRYL